jgi:cobalt-zinc-cadmium efflux system outer membrane protein
MTALRLAGLILILCCGWSSPMHAQGPVTLEALLARAREAAPAVLVARSRIDETRSARTSASVRLQENPEIAGVVGPRWTEGPTRTDFSVGVSQFFETGRRRDSRIAMADADIDAAAAGADRELRDVLRETARGYYRLVSTIELTDVLAKVRDMTADIERIATRRFALGDVAALDVNVARAVRAESEAELASVQADLALQYGALAGLLGWPDLPAMGVARDAITLRDVDPAELAAGIATRPDLIALDALLRSAAAEQQLAAGLARPEFGLSMDFAREEGDSILMGGFVIRLPVFQRGHQQAEAASARLARLRLEREAIRMAAQAELDGSIAAYRHLRAALRALESDALSAAGENEQLGRRSYEAGQISLADWLLYRRQLVDVVRQHIEQKLQCALTLVDIDSLAGVMR